jgi:hypothetical protein
MSARLKEEPIRYEEMLRDRDSITWNSRWLESEKGRRWTHEIFPNLQSREQANYDPMPEMVHFLTGDGRN